MIKKSLAYVKRHKVVFIVAWLFVILVLASGYLGRGYIRNDILPWYAQTQNSDRLKSVTLSEYKKLDRPLQIITENDPANDMYCGLDIAIQWRTSVFCDYRLRNVKPLTAAAKANYQTNAAVIEVALHKNGWLPAYHDTQVAKTDPALYPPEVSLLGVMAGYSKSVGDINCQINFVADGSYFYRCGQDHHYLGDPYEHL